MKMSMYPGAGRLLVAQWLVSVSNVATRLHPFAKNAQDMIWSNPDSFLAHLINLNIYIYIHIFTYIHIYIYIIYIYIYVLNKRRGAGW